MTTESIRELSNRFPVEIVAALDGVRNATNRAIFVLLFDEDRLAFTELQKKLGDDDKLHPTTLNQALDEMQKAGLIRQRLIEDSEEPFSSYYEVTEYGERLINVLFQSLGEVERNRTPSAQSNRTDPDERMDNSQQTEVDDGIFDSLPERVKNAN